MMIQKNVSVVTVLQCTDAVGAVVVVYKKMHVLVIYYVMLGRTITNITYLNINMLLIRIDKNKSDIIAPFV